MHFHRSCLLLLVSFILLQGTVSAQVVELDQTLLYSTKEEIPLREPDSLFTLREIKIDGAKHTRNRTIFRELSFATGQQLPLTQLAEQLAESRKRLMNTGLFLDVTVTLNSLQGHDAFVKIEVRERWYIYPIPFVRMVDRSFGRWMKEKDMDMGRVNYGIKFTHKNFSGRNDRLTLNFTNGYTKAIGFSYNNLFLDSKMKWSASLGASMGRNKELNYATYEHKLQGYKDHDFVQSYFRAFAEVSYRRAIYTTHTFGMAYGSQHIGDTIMAMNPAYSFGRNRIRQPELYYNMSYFNVDFIPYPTKGLIASVQVSKRGFERPLNVWQLGVRTSASWTLSPKSFFNLRTVGLLKLPFKQPYINTSLVSGGDMYLQGYEYYILDGVAAGYTKATLARQLFSTNIGIPSERFRRLNHIPLKAYAKIYGNVGYIHNPAPGNNPLANRTLFSGGVGLDIITFYDFIVKLEWSFNQVGQNDIHVHRKDYF